MNATGRGRAAADAAAAADPDAAEAPLPAELPFEQLATPQTTTEASAETAKSNVQGLERELPPSIMVETIPARATGRLLSTEMKLTDRVAFVIGTWFGCGESKVAPGTVGSIGAVPLHLLLYKLPLVLHWAAIVVLSLVGIWASDRVAHVLDLKDPQRVVVDEVAGTLIAMGMVRDLGPWVGAAALVAFRFFDITKPGPIRRAEHAEPPGLGIMLDDLVAGAVAGAVTRLGALAVFRAIL